MTKIDDPEEIFHQSLAEAGPRTEEAPPVIRRAEVWPYPELTRVWVRIEVSPFAAYPNLELVITDAEAHVVSTLFIVEIREVYQSLTLHLRQTPQAGAHYELAIELTRDDAVLDRRVVGFDLTFQDPKETSRQDAAI